MVTENIDIVIRERGSRVVRRALEDIGDVANRSVRSLRLMQNALFVLGGAGILRSLQGMLDTLTNFENRLRLVTDNTRELNFVQQELFNISNRTRSSFEGTAEIFTRTALAVRQLGVSQRETLQFTESLNQAVILSGASVREANAALIQLSQGLASDRLSGDELRSVLEQLPFVADVIAKSLGVTRGELRQLGRQGKITAEIILKAFREARVEIAGKFAETIPTIGQSFTVLKNNFLEFLDALDDGSMLSEAVARSIILIADNLKFLILGFTAAGISFVSKFVGPMIKGLATTTIAEIKYQTAVAKGSVIALGSVKSNQLRTASLLAEAEASKNLATAKVRELEMGLQELTQNAALLRQQQASIMIDNQRRIARDALTGRFIAYNEAVAQNIRTNRALGLTEKALLSTKAELSAAIAAQTAATKTLSVAQLQANKVAASANTIGQKLIRIIPGLGLLVGALRSVIALLGGPVSAAFFAIFAIMALWKTRSQEIEAANNAIEETVRKVQEAYKETGRAVDDVRKSLVGLTEVEILRQIEHQADLVEKTTRALNVQLLQTSARFVALGDNGKFVLQFLQKYREDLQNGTLNTAEFRKVLSTLASGSGSVFQDLLVELIKLSRDLDIAQNGSKRLEAALAVLNGTATDSQRALLGLGDTASTAASKVRDLGSAALGTINVLRTLKEFIPELSRAQKISDDLAKAQNVYTIGIGQLNSKLRAGNISFDQYVSGLTELESTYARARSEIDGTAQAQREALEAFKEYSSESSLRALDDRSRAIELETRRYNELIETLKGAENSTLLISEATKQYHDRIKEINEQFNKIGEGGGGGGVPESLTKTKEVLESILKPIQEYNSMIRILNNLLKEGKISQDQFTQSMRRTRIEFLETQTDLASGYERGFLKILEKTQDVASKTEQIITSAFDSMSQAIADLVVDGEADFSSLIRSINKQIVQLVVSQAFQQLFGGTGPGGSGGGGNIFQHLIKSVGSLFGLQRGGSFTVGSSTGVAPLPNGGNDNRLVAFRAQDGETISVTPRGQSPGGNTQNVVVNFNITTQDVDSFRKSESQLASRAAKLISRGQRNL